MKVAVFNTKSYDRTFLEWANNDHKYKLVFYEARLAQETLVHDLHPLRKVKTSLAHDI